MRIFTRRRVDNNGVMTETKDLHLSDIAIGDCFTHDETDEWFVATCRPYRNKDGILIIQCNEVK